MTHQRRAVCLSAAIFSLVFVLAGAAAPARAADRLEAFSRFAAAGESAPPDAPWAAFLAAHVHPQANGGPSLVSYGAVTPAERQALAGYLAALAAARPTTFARNEAFAYWANLYNALTVQLILDNFPVKSIMNIKSGPISIGPWDRKAVTVEGASLSFNDIEHKILRRYFADNRVHYALNCASLGCPDLKATPWRAASLDADLDAAARRYINSRRGVAFDGDKLAASSIYKWYGGDFGASDAARIAHFSRYADAPLKQKLASAKKIDRFVYDWSLNSRP